ncbi:MAG: glycosyltransferase family 4 protein [Acidimicrobiales bacterium]
MKARIGVLATTIEGHGGIQRYGHQVCASIEAEGHALVLRESARWRSTPARLAGVAGLASQLRSCDLLWTLHPRLAVAGGLASRRADVPHVVSTYGFENWGKYSWAMRQALRRADAITAISAFSAALMGDAGRDAILLRPTWGQVSASPAGNRAQRERRSILFVGRLGESYKGVDLVLEVAARFSGDGLWRFVLAGDGRLSPDLDAKARRLANTSVVVAPTDDELNRLYQEAAVVLLPSRAQRLPGNRWVGGEGFGIVLLEAALAGATVLASDQGACPETVALLGNGLVRPPTEDEFEAGLRLLLADPELRTNLAGLGARSAERLAPEVFQQKVAGVVALALQQA